MSASADAAAEIAGLEQLRTLCDNATPGDTSAATAALSKLHEFEGQGQPELEADLLASPPNFRSASERIDAIETALRRPASTADPVKADRDLKSILADPRYRVNGPSIFDRLWVWLVEQLLRLLSLIGGSTRGASLAQLVEAALAAAVLAVVAVFLVRSLWGRIRTVAEPGTPKPAPRPASDWFAEADRLAAEGDLPAALRALTMAVATRVGGENAWDRSPLTVRELFGKASLLPGLRPLVVPFEASVYGHRQPNAAIYADADAVAMPFREATGEEAAA